MKKADEITPNYAPVYCAAMYPDLCAVFQRHGYALAVHGSLVRDFDLIAVPWTDDASKSAAVIADVLWRFALTPVGQPESKPHGRIAYTLAVCGECAVDLSFMPIGGAR